jgi:hypothetical protein
MPGLAYLALDPRFRGGERIVFYRNRFSQFVTVVTTSASWPQKP